MAQLLPKARILVVTTPQAAAADVAERAGAIATQTGQTVAALWRTCPSWKCPTAAGWSCFGSGGGAVLAERLSATVGADVPLLGQIPLDIRLREGGDAGVPLVLGRPETPAAVALLDIAGKLAAVPRGLKACHWASSPADWECWPAAPAGSVGRQCRRVPVNQPPGVLGCLDVEGRRLAFRQALDHPWRRCSAAAAAATTETAAGAPALTGFCHPRAGLP